MGIRVDTSAFAALHCGCTQQRVRHGTRQALIMTCRSHQDDLVLNLIGSHNWIVPVAGVDCVDAGELSHISLAFCRSTIVRIPLVCTRGCSKFVCGRPESGLRTSSFKGRKQMLYRRSPKAWSTDEGPVWMQSAVATVTKC